ncbi:MAG: hypothetical protein ACPGEG_08620 [Salibacteraceae bacterium]
MNRLAKYISIFLGSAFIVGCNCRSDSYKCQSFSSELNSLKNTFEKTNYIFKSNSGKTVTINTASTIPNVEVTESCDSQGFGCSCEPCNSSVYYELHVEDSSGAIQFWHITINTNSSVDGFTNGRPNISGSESITVETVTFSNTFSIPMRSSSSVQLIDDFNIGANGYENVYKVESLNEKESEKDVAYFYLSSVNGLLGFKEIGSNEIYYRQ